MIFFTKQSHFVSIILQFVFDISVEFDDTSEVNRGSWGDLTSTLTIGNGEDATQESVKVVTFKANLPDVSHYLFALCDQLNRMS